MTVAISQTVRRKLKQYTTWSRILPRASLQLEKYSLSSRWLILFELRAKRQKVPIGSCWSNFLAHPISRAYQFRGAETEVREDNE